MFEFQATLAVVRAEHETVERFREVFAAVLRRLEVLIEEDPARWRELAWFALSFALLRRPGDEHAALPEAARSSQMDVRHREVVGELTENVVETWEQELLRRGRTEGVAIGEAQGRLVTTRENLQLLLTERFGPLPEPLIQRLTAIDDVERLRAALRQFAHLTSLDDLAL